LTVVIVCAAALGWWGCNAEKDYKTLTFFFDGVPDPHASKRSSADLSTPRSAGLSVTGGVGGGQVVSVHKPFAEEKCTSCHAQPSDVFSATMDTNLCLNCHQKVMTEYPAMHGPVIGKACLWCHEPHESTSVSLLKTTAASLCLQCHERELLTTRVEGHQQETGSCLDCHKGHGGHAIPFLRADALALPATRPNP
jgi:predicted CXXCH cytochrome family protein